MKTRPQSRPKVDDYEVEAVNALVKTEILLGPGTEIENIVGALRGIGFAVLATKEKPAVTEMLDHCAGHDHVLELRLIDTDVFGVRCADPHCPFRTEWRT